MDEQKKQSLPRLLDAAAQMDVVGPAALARALNSSDQAVNNWKARGVPASVALRAQTLWGVSADWLLSGSGEMWVRTPGSSRPKPQLIDLENNPDYPTVERVRFKLSAGASGFSIEYEKGNRAPIAFQREWYERNGYRPDKLFAIDVANGSMEPGLYDGDTVIVNTEQAEPKDGRVFAVNYEGEMVVKRLIRDDGQWWLSSDNPDQRRYPRKVCHEGVFLLGEVVHKQSERI